VCTALCHNHDAGCVDPISSAAVSSGHAHLVDLLQEGIQGLAQGVNDEADLCAHADGEAHNGTWLIDFLLALIKCK
jgi:hypothetical protein